MVQRSHLYLTTTLIYNSLIIINFCPLPSYIIVEAFFFFYSHLEGKRMADLQQSLVYKILKSHWADIVKAPNSGRVDCSLIRPGYSWIMCVSGCREPAHKIPPMTRSRGENLTGKVDQVFRGFEKLPPALALKMISVFLMPASIDYSLISVTQAEGLPQSLSN